MIDDILDTVVHGDALEVLKTMPDACIDAIVADPPAGINFMNAEFDSSRGGRNSWVKWLSDIMTEAKRTLRAGGHALIWSLPRTSHWTALALEDAGFQIRDNIYNLVSGDTLLLNFLNSLNEEQQHAFMQVLDAQREPSGILQIFGSGFPKSHNISIAIDKYLNAKREIIGINEAYKARNPRGMTGSLRLGGFQSLEALEDAASRDEKCPDGRNARNVLTRVEREKIQAGQITAPSSDAAKLYDGYGSALKPACENWWLVRKPLAASSIAENVLTYGTGAINVDECRIGNESTLRNNHTNGIWASEKQDNVHGSANGRFPSHLLITHTPSCIQVGTKRVQANGPAHKENETKAPSPFFDGLQINSTIAYRDEDGMETVTAWECPEWCPVRILDFQSGASNSRISVKGKAGNAKFNGKYNNGEVYANASDQTGGYTDSGGASRYFKQFPALDDIPPYIYAGKASRRDRTADNTVVNTHPTVKSVHGLMRYLVRLITPKDGIVLDCFCGSGSTLCAAIYEGFHFVGIEREEEYVEIARKRILHAMSASGTQHPEIPLAPSVPTTVRKARNTVHSSQLSLWNMEGEAV